MNIEIPHMENSEGSAESIQWKEYLESERELLGAFESDTSTALAEAFLLTSELVLASKEGEPEE